MPRIHGIHQSRAADTAQRFASAALRLLAHKPLAEISVLEIVERAESSVGAFYARFACKEALVDWLCEDRLTAAAARLESRFDELQTQGASIVELVHAYVDAAASFFESEAVLLREVIRMADAGDIKEVLGRTLNANARVDRRFIRRLTAHAGRLSSSAARSSASFSTVVVAAVLRSYVLFPDTLPPAELGRSGHQLRRELAAWILARFDYLTAKQQ
jgi:AcrR family transcriptional regulator